jgi:predicted RNase H-related nuclease YkuK (DUF458 family)
MKFNIPHIKQFIEAQGPNTRIYIGVDSVRLRGHDKLWYADFTAAIVVHINGNNGCKLFGEVTRERDYDRVDKPNTRLMMEVFKASELYLRLAEVLEGREVSVHLDINPDDHHASSNVVAQAIGYIRGTCNVIPMVKPNAWAASYAADRLRSLKIANG